MNATPKRAPHSRCLGFQVSEWPLATQSGCMNLPIAVVQTWISGHSKTESCTLCCKTYVRRRRNPTYRSEARWSRFFASVDMTAKSATLSSRAEIERCQFSSKCDGSEGHNSRWHQPRKRCRCYLKADVAAALDVATRDWLTRTIALLITDGLVLDDIPFAPFSNRVPSRSIDTLFVPLKTRTGAAFEAFLPETPHQYCTLGPLSC